MFSISIGTHLPLELALFCNTFVGWFQVDLIIIIRKEQTLLCLTDIRCIAINVHRLTTTFSRDPSRCCPLADTPGRMFFWTSKLIAILATIVATRVAPIRLMSEVKKGSCRITNFGTHSVRRVMIATTITTRITFTDCLVWLNALVLLPTRDSRSCSDHCDQEECTVGIHGFIFNFFLRIYSCPTLLNL
jgi:hypothetical protein